MDEETRQAIDSIDKRLQKLEALVVTDKAAKAKLEARGKKDYSGLQGGITLLIDEHFFDVPKSMLEIMDQLAIKVYHYKRGAVQTALNRDFMKKKHILTRIKENGRYKYVIKKIEYTTMVID